MLRVCQNPETGRQVLLVGEYRGNTCYVTGAKGVVDLFSRGTDEFNQMYKSCNDTDLLSVISALRNPGDGWVISSKAGAQLRWAFSVVKKGDTMSDVKKNQPKLAGAAKSTAKPVPAGKASATPAKPAKPLAQPAKVEKPVAAANGAAKAVTAAKVPAKPAAKAETTGRTATHTDDTKIKFNAENPKREGTATHSRYEGYKKAKTVGEAISLGASRGDVNYSIAHGEAELI